MIVFIGALFGFFSVAFGAYAEHGLKKQISEDVFYSVLKALRFNQVYAILLVVLGLVIVNADKFTGISAGLLRYSAYAFILGIVLFCFSIYGSAVFSYPSLTKVAPFGGTMFMVGWLILAWAGIRA